jgi:hypothetical protein
VIFSVTITATSSQFLGPWSGSGRLTAHQPSSGTIDCTPDDHHPLMPRRNPEDIDLGAIKTDLEFLIERVTRFRKEQALKPLYTMVGSAAIVIAWIELFRCRRARPSRSCGPGG